MHFYGIYFYIIINTEWHTVQLQFLSIVYCLNIHSYDYNFHVVKLLVIKSFLTEVFWLAHGSFLYSNMCFSIYTIVFHHFFDFDFLLWVFLLSRAFSISSSRARLSPKANKDVVLEHSYSYIVDQLDQDMNYKIKLCLPSQSNSLGSVLISTSEQSSSVHTLPLFLFEFFWG